MGSGGRMDRGAFCRLVEELAQIARDGHGLILVTSGAVAVGRQKLGLDKRPTGDRNIPKLQALAALGQSRLMQLYEEEFFHYGVDVAQVLLTRDDFNHRRRYLNARHALAAIQGFGAVPIINENDTVGTEEIRFGDNDQLAAMVAAMVGADTLTLLSDIDGVYTSDPRSDPSAVRLESVHAMDPALDAMVGDTFDAQRGFGTGGMRTKIAAARIAGRAGIGTIIAPGKSAGVLARVVRGDEGVGTFLKPDPDSDRMDGRKAWISTGITPRGRIWCDAGAVEALRARGKSLLPSGVIRVEGEFKEGEAVEVVTPEGRTFARGLAIYGAEAMRLIAGQRSERIEALLGYHILDVAIHRDDLVLD